MTIVTCIDDKWRWLINVTALIAVTLEAYRWAACAVGLSSAARSSLKCRLFLASSDEHPADMKEATFNKWALLESIAVAAGSR